MWIAEQAVVGGPGRTNMHIQWAAQPGSIIRSYKHLFIQKDYASLALLHLILESDKGLCLHYNTAVYVNTWTSPRTTPGKTSLITSYKISFPVNSVFS